MTDVKMPLTAHLDELRWRLIKSLAAVGVAAALCYSFADLLFDWLAEPLMSINVQRGEADGTVRLIGTGVVEAFFTKLKVAVIAGLFLASPIVLYQIWEFTAPGLLESEKRSARPFVFFGTIFFVSGAWFCYETVLPVGYRFFIDQYGTIGVAPEIRISEYLSFTSRLLLAFGVTFELPVVTFFLARLGVVTHHTMIHYSRYAVLFIFILAAILTPGPDVASQLLMAGPLLALYLVSIGVAFVFGKRPAVDADE
jgi:sec-independent protein translocase protein TatC